MKIGILTLQLIKNYGGILQAFALQTVLKNMGHETVLIKEPRIYKLPFWKLPFSYTKRILNKYILRKKNAIDVFSEQRNEKQLLIECQNIQPFIDKNIQMQDLAYVKKNKKKFNVIIVGSDQIWRPKYHKNITNAYLFFAQNWKIKRIAYAASFGTDIWEYSGEQTKNCKSLVKKFDAISVREDSALELCRKYLDVEAIHVLDPTMLLTKEHYINLTKQDNIPKRENILFSYILDISEEKNALIQKVVKEFGLFPVAGIPSNSLKKSKQDISDCIFYSVTEWIAGFRDAKFVITDSFHGTVFSILFNKPFVVFTNERRGNTRFNSLLKMFNLENRLITTAVDFKPFLLTLDYLDINRKIERERKKSIDFLLNALKS